MTFFKSFFQSREKSLLAESNNNSKMVSAVSVRPMVNFAVFGLGVIGPMTHFFYKYLDVILPPSAKATNKLNRDAITKSD